jgi:hypothetical protein
MHKNFCPAIVDTPEGEVLKEGRIPTEKEDITAFFSGLERLEIALEASTNYEYYFDLLESMGHRVVVAHPLKTRMIADAVAAWRSSADLLRAAEGAAGAAAPCTAPNRAGTNSKRAQDADKD